MTEPNSPQPSDEAREPLSLEKLMEGIDPSKASPELALLMTLHEQDKALLDAARAEIATLTEQRDIALNAGTRGEHTHHFQPRRVERTEENKWEHTDLRCDCGLTYEQYMAPSPSPDAAPTYPGETYLTHQDEWNVPAPPSGDAMEEAKQLWILGEYEGDAVRRIAATLTRSRRAAAEKMREATIAAVRQAVWNVHSREVAIRAIRALPLPPDAAS